MDFPYSGEIAGLCAAVLWATASYIWERYRGKLSPFAINAFKAAFGLVILSLVLFLFTGEIWPRSLTWRQQGILLASGIVGLGIGDVFYFVALTKLGARRSLVMWLMAPPFAAILGVLFLHERISPLGWGGIALTLAGVGLVQSERKRTAADESPHPTLDRQTILLGVFAGILASLGQAVSSAMTKAVLIEQVNPIQAVQVRLASAFVFLLLVGIISGKLLVWGQNLRPVKVFVPAAIAVILGTVVGLACMTYSQGKIPIGLSNTLTSTSPLFALPLALFILREQVSMRSILGTILAVAGVAMMFLQ